MRISDWSSDVCSSDLASGSPVAGATSLAGADGAVRDSDVSISTGACLTDARIARKILSPTKRIARIVVARVRKSAAPRADISPEGLPPTPSPPPSDRRSEEHTSELQSLMRISYAVFCLKKKKQ